MISQASLKHYAYALLDIGKSENKVEVFKKDLETFRTIEKENPGLLKLLASPMVPEKEKEQILSSIREAVDIEVFGFLEILRKRHVVEHYEEIYQDYLHLYREYHGELEGRIYTSFPLSEETLKKTEEVFSKKYGRKVTFKVYIDKRILGGMRVYVNDTLYDYSLETKLNRIQDKLVSD